MHFAKFAHIHIPGIPMPLTYGVPDDMVISSGHVVSVPLGKGIGQGIVQEISNKAEIDPSKLKPILDIVPIAGDMKKIMALCQSLAKYYLCPWPEIYAQFVNHSAKSLDYVAFYKTTETGKNLTPVQKKLHQIIQKQPGISAYQIKELGFNQKTVDCLLRIDAIEPCQKPLNPKPNLVQLNTQQQKFVSSMNLTAFSVSLLWGVTGSGKTECFTHLIDQLANHDKQCLILVPEIGLVDQTAAKIRLRLNETVATYHSAMSKGEKSFVTRALVHNEVRLVVATRSGIFLPFNQLSLIIVDEEHDTSYQQETGWLYQARDVAIWRAKHEDIPILLASATPSLSSLKNAQQGKFNLFHLREKALNTKQVKTWVYDIKDQRLHAGFSEKTIHQIEKTLHNKQHVIIFVPRRGYSIRYLCEGCGWIANCQNCSTGLVYHAKKGLLQCHHCNYHTPIKKECPECRLHEPKPIGYGTEQVSEFLSQQFSNKVWCADSDNIDNPQDIHDMVKDLADGEPQIIVGTQMISKGHDFKRVGLVVIHQADFCVHPADPYSHEKFVQQFFQIKGRAARDANQEGQIIIQTRRPENELIKELVQGELEHIYTRSLQERKDADFPPFSVQAKIIAKSKHPTKAQDFLAMWKKQLLLKDAIWLGPAPCLMEKRAGYYRFQSHITSSSRAKLIQNLLEIKKRAPKKNHYSLIWTIEMDPLEG